MGAWEGPACLTCRLPRSRQSTASNADVALMVLEEAAGPLTDYDVARGIRTRFGRTVPRPSLRVSLSSDRRFCWAGKGLYGLYRHGLLPGPRSLAGVAKIILRAYGAPLDLRSLSFAMKHFGYRFGDVSLYYALARDSEVTLGPDRHYCMSPNDKITSSLLELRCAPNRAKLNDLLAQVSKRTSSALSELEKRLSNRPGAGQPAPPCSPS